MTYAIVTDSTCDLPIEVVRELQINVVPMYIIWGTQSYKDGVDISKTEFYARLQTDSQHPKTSQPTPNDFADAYRRAKDNGAEGVLCLVVSSGVSGTYNSAVQAVEMVDIPVTVIDTKVSTIAMGFLVMTAAEARASGKSLQETADLIRDSLNKVSLFFTLATLEYLRRGGRIGMASRVLGDTLNIKPILTAVDGVIAPKDRVRTAKRALQTLADIVKAEINGRPVKRLGIFHAQAESDVEKLSVLLAELNTDIMVVPVCTAVGTHGGPGLYGVAYELK
jgi:DegV family protein with EDD domain